MFKVRKGYVLVDKKGKPISGMLYLPDNSPLLKGQMHKVEKVADRHYTEETASATEVDPDVLSAELASLTLLKRNELLALYEKYLGTPKPDMTTPDLKRDIGRHLRATLTQVNKPKTGSDHSGDEPVSGDGGDKVGEGDLDGDLPDDENEPEEASNGDSGIGESDGGGESEGAKAAQTGEFETQESNPPKKAKSSKKG